VAASHVRASRETAHQNSFTGAVIACALFGGAAAGPLEDVSAANATWVVKIEVNFVMGGTANPVRRAPLIQNTRDSLQVGVEIPVVSLRDGYGGKLVAAMDWQHVRDGFDVMQLLPHAGIAAVARRSRRTSSKP
jgi:Nucleotidyl transferase AbiEii toxin, Type IV TA system